MYWWQIILFPFALLFYLITWIRNALYDRQIKQTVSFDANVIVIGNLAIGGTGKTPMVDYLINYFNNLGVQPATLSRGYGRKTYGFKLADYNDTATTIGDEPYMYHYKYRGEVPVAVCSDREMAIPELLGSRPDTEVILMDDAMQHRRVKPSVTVMLTSFGNIFTNDFVLPSGRLRESRNGAGRAQIIVVTKCPESLSDADMVKIKEHISQYSKAKVFFSTVIYEPLKPIFDEEIPLKSKVLGISGLANAKPFEDYLKKNYSVKLTYNYRDHYHYKGTDIRDIIRELDDATSLITTEKDMVKLQAFPELKPFSCYYLPIRMKFLKNESLFLSELNSYLVKQLW